uniref:Uncharacterized protein n=1 Tax=Xenopus tropicalis TaxID=8364 RepID=A0A803JU53_XENTR
MSKSSLEMKQKQKLLKFYGDSDALKLMAGRKTLHHAKNTSHRSERFLISRTLLMTQSSGWYGKFKKRNHHLIMMLLKHIACLVQKPSCCGICNMVLNDNSDEESDNDEQDVIVKPNISIKRMIKLSEELICGMEQKSFITEQQITSVYKIKEQLLRERPKHMKQMSLTEMFQNVQTAPLSLILSL